MPRSYKATASPDCRPHTIEPRRALGRSLFKDDANADCRPIAGFHRRKSAATSFLAFGASLLILLLAGCREVKVTNNGQFFNIRQIQQLCADRHSSQTVHFRGAVTLVDDRLNFIVVQDATGGIRVRTSLYPDVSLVGRQVEIAGRTAIGPGQESVTEASVRDSGSASQIASRHLSLADLSSDRFDNLLVTLNGVLSSEHVDSAGVLVLRLNVFDKQVDIRVMDDRNKPVDNLLDADVAVTGVADSSVDVDGKVKAFNLLASTMNSVTVIRKAADLRTLPLKTVAWADSQKGVPMAHRMRFRGVIRGTRETSDLQLVDETGAIPLRDASAISSTTGVPVTVAAFVSFEGGRQVLDEVTVLDAEPVKDRPAPLSRGPTLPLTTTAQVRNLSAEEARLLLPVEVAGVLTYYDGPAEIMFIQDDTAGIFVSMRGLTLPVKSGDYVHISGVTGAGDFAPVIQKPHVRILGHKAYPLPSSMSAEKVFFGHADSQWVELEGVIRNITPEGSSSAIHLSWGAHQFNVYLPSKAVKDVPRDWINARVRVRGVCATNFNFKRQLVGIRLMVPDLSQFTILEPGASGTFNTAARPIDTILRFSAGEDDDRRIRVHGIVTATNPHGPTWIRDTTGALCVRDHNEVILKPGDIVDAVGFASPGAFSPEILDANIRREAGESSVMAEPVTADQAFSGNFDAKLIQIGARLVNQFSDGRQRTLLMQAGRHTFLVKGAADLADFPVGSVLRVTGICSVTTEHSHGMLLPRSFEIFLRSPSDVVLLHHAPWLTLDVTLRALGITVLLVGVALVWVLALRRRVDRQTSIIAQKLFEVKSLQTVAESANRDMQLILNNIEEGLVTINVDGQMSSESSRAAKDWFGTPVGGETFAAWIGRKDIGFGEWFSLALETLQEGMLPAEVALGQFPGRIKDGEKTYSVHYQLITGAGDRPGQILAIITDITEILSKDAGERHQSELLQLFQHMMRDKAGFLEFLAEADDIMLRLNDGRYDDLDHLRRLVHTLKGNSAIFGMSRVSQICHELENTIAEQEDAPAARVEMSTLWEAWAQIRSDIEKLIGEVRQKSIEIDDAEYESILQTLRDGVDTGTVVRMLESWRLEPTSKRLVRVEHQIKSIAERMGKSNVSVSIEPNDLRFNSARFAPFWSAFIHVLRNAVDHGIEDRKERQRGGKPEQSAIRVATAMHGDWFVITVEDDGPGVDWERLRRKAGELGDGAGALEESWELLCLPGLSSKDSVTELSGRGMGMSAVADACAALGGTIAVKSQRGVGTRIEIAFPKDQGIYEGHTAMLQLASALAAAPAKVGGMLTKQVQPAQQD